MFAKNMKNMDRSPEKTTRIIQFMNSKNTVNVSVRKISREVGVTKNKAFATCMNDPRIVKVDPHEFGSGMNKLGVFRYTV